MSLDVPFMSAFLNYRAQQPSYIVILCTTKILLLPRFLKCTFPLPALTETCFEVNMLGEVAPDRLVCSVGEGIDGGGDVLAALATSYSRDLIEYTTADACCKRMKQVLVRLPNERPECNDINLGDCLRLLRTQRGRTIVSYREAKHLH